MEVGVSVLRSVAWSHWCCSGNCLEATSENPFSNWWYFGGTNSCQVFFPLSVAFSASCYATVVLRMFASFTTVSAWASMTVPIVCPSFQSIIGLVALKNIYPKIRSSSPIFAMKKGCVAWWSLCNCHSRATCLTFPVLLMVPSMFWTLYGFSSLVLVRLYLLTSCGWMKHLIAPLSRSASSLVFTACWFRVTIAFINLFLAMYGESNLHTWMRAMAFRHPENSSSHPLLALLWRRCLHRHP
jgi:hypothetical protein